jgi:pyruvate,water dikinase
LRVPQCWTPRDGSKGHASWLGGKGAHLARLSRAGQRVPRFFAVTTRAFEDTLRHNGVDALLREKLDPNVTTPSASAVPFHEEAGAIREKILTLQFPEALARSITAAAAELGEGFLAVRSSAAGEDSAAASFAGVHETRLFIRGERELLEAIRHVWASAFSERALVYRRTAGQPLDDITMAIVVQRMIDARSSGVLFTAAPTTNDPRFVVISSLFGLGEGLVSEGFDADTFTLKKEKLEIEERVVVEKRDAIVFDRATGHGVCRVTLDETKSNAASLSDDELRELARRGLEIERLFGRPQDIEFCVDAAGVVYILQSRAITTVESFGPAAGTARIWDNSNIVESFSGVTSPMTFSVIRRAYTIVYRCFAEVMGIRPEVVEKNREVFGNMLGFFRGQVYYNLLNWYAAVKLFPGFDYNRAFMESMMGVKESASLDEPTAPASFSRRYFVELPALLRLVTRSTANFLRIRTLVAEFQKNFRTNYERWSAIDLDELTLPQLMALYDEFEDRVLWNWRAPIINDFYVMVFYGILKKLASSWCGDEGGSLQNDLICGEGGIESTEPANELLRLAAAARRDEALKAMIRDGEPANALRNIRRDERFDDFSNSIDRYLDVYGFRCMNELKLEELSLRDRPEFLLTLMRNYLEGESDRLDPSLNHEREIAIRRAAEERAYSRIRSPFKRMMFRRVLNAARLGVKNRENMRFARTRIFGLVREVMRAAGRRLHEEEFLDQPEDVFYLTLDELRDFVKGTAVSTDFRGTVAVRKREFTTYRNDLEAFPDDRFETFGAAYMRNVFRRPAVAAQASSDGLLRGVACSPGSVSGAVKVLRSPNDDARLNGEILVAERTDPGWVPLYPSISGLLIERGSILSHSAIVAREMGIPTIVGIAGLSKLLKSGDRVAMDGSAGTVEILSSTP